MFLIKKNRTIKESGQIALIVLLASALILTVSMSISRKTVVETRIDTDEELLKQAFNTAESGIEYYLATGETGPDTYINASGGNASISTEIIGGDTSIDSNGVILDGSPFLFWLVDHDGANIGSDRYSGDITISVDDSSFDGGLKVDLYTYDGSDYEVIRYGYNIGGSFVNDFTDVGGNSVSINGISGGMLLVITPIEYSSSFTLSGTANFPAQGEVITSVGEMNSGVNTTVRVENRFEVPIFMLEAISAGGQIVNSL